MPVDTAVFANMSTEPMCSPILKEIKLYKLKQFINCATIRVTCMVSCPRNKIYIGKTKRQLRIRICEHIGSNKNDDQRPLTLHF